MKHRISTKQEKGGPFLRRISTRDDVRHDRGFPFSIPAFSNGIDIELKTAVTCFVGENGSGKSTLLEAMADQCGFHIEGGSRDHRYKTRESRPALAPWLRLSWMPKVTSGFFLRAESFFNFATYLEELAENNPSLYRSYGGKSLHAQSHGESFLALFRNRFSRGIYILDEPEAALSPQRQLAFLVIVHELVQGNQAQFIIATHSPMMLAYPGAEIFSLDGSSIKRMDYRETEHFRLMRNFLESPERFFAHLFDSSAAVERGDQAIERADD